VVVINRSDASQRLRLPMATEGATFEAVFSTTDDAVGVTMEEEAVVVEVPALAGVVLSARKE